MSFPTGWAGYDEHATTTQAASSQSGVLYAVNIADLSSTWKGEVQADGGDIRVSEDDNTRLPLYLYRWAYNSGAPTGIIFFSRSSLASGEKVRIWAGAASGTETQPAANAAFGSEAALPADLIAFYPDGGGNDVTSSANNLTMYGSPTVGGADGPFGALKATNYTNSSSQYGLATAVVPSAVPFTYVVWGQRSAGSNARTAGGIYRTGDAQHYAQLNFAGNVTDSPIRYSIRGGATGATNADKTSYTTAWHLAAGRSASSTSHYATLDGVDGTQNTANRNPTSLDTLAVACHYPGASPTAYFDGDLSLVQFYDIALSEDWLAYQNAQRNQSTFWGTWSWTANSTPSTDRDAEFPSVADAPLSRTTSRPATLTAVSDSPCARTANRTTNLTAVADGSYTRTPQRLVELPSAADVQCARQTFRIVACAATADATYDRHAQRQPVIAALADMSYARHAQRVVTSTAVADAPAVREAGGETTNREFTSTAVASCLVARRAFRSATSGASASLAAARLSHRMAEFVSLASAPVGSESVAFTIPRAIVYPPARLQIAVAVVRPVIAIARTTRVALELAP